MFSEENYVPPTTIGVGKHANCSLLCHNDPSIIIKEKHSQTQFGQTMKLQSAMVTVNIRPRSLKYIQLFSVFKQCLYASLV